MKTQKNLKINKKGSVPIKSDSEDAKHKKVAKDRSSKRRLSIYDDFDDDMDDFYFNNDDFLDEE